MENSSMTTLMEPEDSLINIPLPRGEACLPCRKRKSKCDGTKPICRQCARGKRANDCRYDPSKAWSRNRKLQHRLMQVERRMMQMESKIQSPPPSTPEIQPQFSFENSDFQTLAPFDLLGTSSNPATSSLMGSIDQDSGHHTTSSSPEDHSQWFEAQGSRSASVDYSSGFDSSSDGEGPALNEAGLSPEFQDVLLHAFLSHRHQLAFQVERKHLHASHPIPSPEKAHPSLRNIIFALGCYFSRLSWLGTQEAHFVDQAVRSIQIGLSKGEKLLDVVQACCLLASYSFLKGNVLETNYHVACATRLATGLGLHQILTSEYGSPWALNNTILIPSRDAGGVVEAATVFWKIFIVDRLYSVALGVPPTLVDDNRPRTRIRTPLPDRIPAFQPTEHTWGDPNSPLSAFFSVTQGQSSADLTEAHVASLYAKVSELFERASRISYASSTDEGFVALESTLSEAWTALPLTLPPRSGGNYTDESLSYSLMALRSLIHAATVQLHRQLSLKELSSHAKSLAAAEHIITIIREYWDADFAYFDPILGTAWMFVTEVLLRERMLGQHADMTHNDPVQGQLDTVLSAMKRLAALFPVVAIQLAKVEQSMG